MLYITHNFDYRSEKLDDLWQTCAVDSLPYLTLAEDTMITDSEWPLVKGQGLDHNGVSDEDFAKEVENLRKVLERYCGTKVQIHERK